ncbi:MAG: tRNA 2-thiocytidine(32) synthetase TtcA [SAR86 cluster bacterium]|uniref:tRNA-cytidine(32) 2-sulfurtransferase n=1 Tax=SAR86 cluster bacterium TaxID=2030880 RepID=A0A2A4MH71_9GAMM|nr:MAG: tRNA 2-thiocytidine(32) synthetase TtcA [SAR86 cluster bacterium]
MTHSQKDQFKLKRSHKNLRRDVGRAIADYSMIEQGDVVMVCLSGGKDSFAMLDILRSLQKHAPIDFKIIAVNLDQKQPGFPEHVLPEFLRKEGVEFQIIEQDTYSIVVDKVAEGKTFCGLCSRLRRGILYTHAKKIGATKIALGHHREDIIETLFLNMFFAGKLKAMPPKLLSDDKQNVIIRPMAYCKEKEIALYAQLREFPIIPCNLCGTQDNMQRQAIKAMLSEWDKQFPGRVESIFRSICNVSLSQLGDSDLFPFKDLKISGLSENSLELLELV